MPNIRTAKPTSIDAISFFLSFLENVSIATPIIARTGENEDGLSILIRKLSPLMPDRDNIHAVTVVPIFAPIITPMAEWSFMMPAFTKPTSITVVAEEDWITAVTESPSNIALIGFEVSLSNIFSSFPPASFSSPLPITFIP